MFVNEELLAIIFRLVNFGILVFLCVYMFRRYLLPSIKDQMHQEQEEQNSIKKRHKEIRTQEKIVDVFAQDQAALCILLQEKVQRWQRVEADRMHKKEREREKCILRLKERIVSQELEFARQQMLHTITPKAIKNAQEALQKAFSSDDTKRAYVQNIIKQLGVNKMHEEVL